MISQPTLPAPGSDAALDQGCLCPVLDNARGLGRGAPPLYVFTEGCPLHATRPSGAPEAPVRRSQGEMADSAAQSAEGGELR